MNHLKHCFLGLFCLIFFINPFVASGQQDANFLKAIELLDAGEEKEAKKYLDLAISSNPSHDGAYYHRAGVFANEKNFKSALADIQKVVALKPQNIAFILIEAEYQFNLRDFVQSKKTLELYLAQDEYNAKALVLLAKTKKELGEKNYCLLLEKAKNHGSIEAISLMDLWCK